MTLKPLLDVDASFILRPPNKHGNRALGSLYCNFKPSIFQWENLCGILLTFAARLSTTCPSHFNSHFYLFYSIHSISTPLPTSFLWDGSPGGGGGFDSASSSRFPSDYTPGVWPRLPPSGGGGLRRGGGRGSEGGLQPRGELPPCLRQDAGQGRLGTGRRDQVIFFPFQNTTASRI